MTVRGTPQCQPSTKSSSLSKHTFEQLENVYKVPILEAYAMTEASHQMTSNPLPPMKRKAGSVGIAQGVELGIFDEKGLRAERGEVCIRGRNVAEGYLNNRKANEDNYFEGWFRTGDQGFLDEEGYLFLTGRLKELISRGGEKISPLEIDDVLLSHPFVAEAVCFAVEDEKYGQEVQAAVVLKNKVTEKELREYCRGKLAEFKCPKVVYIAETLPKTATGKIQRRMVSEFFAKKKAKL